MKRFYSLVAAALFLAASLSFTGASANGQLDQILAQMQKNAQSIKSISADLRQEKRSVQLGGRETQSGKIYFKHGGPNNDKVRIDYFSGPAISQTVWVVGDQIALYQPPIKQVIITSRKSQAAGNQEFSFIATPYKSVPQLKSQFNVALRGEEQVGSESTNVLDLTPKGRSSIRKAVMWVKKSDGFPIRYQVTENNNDISTFTLSAVKINPSISEGTFKLKWPSGTKEIKK